MRTAACCGASTARRSARRPVLRAAGRQRRAVEAVLVQRAQRAGWRPVVGCAELRSQHTPLCVLQLQDGEHHGAWCMRGSWARAAPGRTRQSAAWLAAEKAGATLAQPAPEGGRRGAAPCGSSRSIFSCSARCSARVKTMLWQNTTWSGASDMRRKSAHTQLAFAGAAQRGAASAAHEPVHACAAAHLLRPSLRARRWPQPLAQAPARRRARSGTEMRQRWRACRCLSPGRRSRAARAREPATRARAGELRTAKATLRGPVRVRTRSTSSTRSAVAISPYVRLSLYSAASLSTS
jgi:hypothetical protein